MVPSGRKRRRSLQEGGRASTESVHTGLNVTFSGSQTQSGSGGVPLPSHFQISSLPSMPPKLYS